LRTVIFKVRPQVFPGQVGAVKNDQTKKTAMKALSFFSKEWTFMAVLLVFYVVGSAVGRHIRLYIPRLQPQLLLGGCIRYFSKTQVKNGSKLFPDTMASHR